MKRTFIILASLLLGLFCNAQNDNVAIDVDLTKTHGPASPIWSWVGYDEPNYTYMKDGAKLLGELAEMTPGTVYVRTHNLFTTGDGVAALKWGSTNVYTEDKKGRPVYDWTIFDRIIDTYINLGMRPLLEIGFMPEALSTHPEPYRHHWSVEHQELWTGWTYPPKSYEKWAELVYQMVRHCADRYGEKEVEEWYFELWNEPDIGYWSGTFEEYCKLYDYTADAVKRAMPNARVGGPGTTDPLGKKAYDYLVGFLKHVTEETNYLTGEVGTPIDFLSFHAKGNPKISDGNVQMNVGRQLGNIDLGFKVVSEFASLKHLPVLITESDPEGCAACSVASHPQNAYRNGTMYSSYTAASVAREYELAAKYGVNFKGAITWAFEFEDQIWFGGFRDLATNGVDKPVLNVFRMFNMMSGNLAQVNSTRPFSADDIVKNSVREEADVNALATIGKDGASIMVWNYHDDNVPADPTDVYLNVSGIDSKRVQVFHYRIDDKYSNSYEAWKAMGSPQDPTPEQIAKLEAAGQLQLYTSPYWVDVEEGNTFFQFELPRQGVSLIKIVY